MTDGTIAKRGRAGRPNAKRGALVLAIPAVVLLALPVARAGDAPPDSSSKRRAERRAYDGAPPVIPHPLMGVTCISCHNEQGMQVPELGFAPPSPHELTRGMSALSRCQQCHVYQATTTTFADSTFVGLPQDLHHGPRVAPGAPPVIPHPILMRENCAACHSGPAAREEIRSSHPQRVRCRQCHVPVTTSELFAR